MVRKIIWKNKSGVNYDQLLDVMAKYLKIPENEGIVVRSLYLKNWLNNT